MNTGGKTISARRVLLWPMQSICPTLPLSVPPCLCLSILMNLVIVLQPTTLFNLVDLISRSLFCLHTMYQVHSLTNVPFIGQILTELENNCWQAITGSKQYLYNISSWNIYYFPLISINWNIYFLILNKMLREGDKQVKTVDAWHLKYL